MTHADDIFAEAHMEAGSEPIEQMVSPEWHEFHVALEHARSWATERPDDFVLLYKSTSGLWTACDDEDAVPTFIHADTEGVLMVWADGRVGILHGVGEAVPVHDPAALIV